uniref:Uncharacterized protein n=1 Tax=Knipowitschia caucasica TaxID=637954 RepID=A0AAV2M4M5_KNICA
MQKKRPRRLGKGAGLLVKLRLSKSYGSSSCFTCGGSACRLYPGLCWILPIFPAPEAAQRRPSSGGEDATNTEWISVHSSLSSTPPRSTTRM